MGLRTSWSRGWHPHEQEGIIGDAEVRAYITKVAAPESLLAERVAMLPKRNSFFSIKSFYTCTLKTLSSLWLENIQNEVVIEWTSCGVDVWYSMNCNVTRWCPDVESVRGLAFYFLTPCSESQQTLSCTCFDDSKSYSGFTQPHASWHLQELPMVLWQIHKWNKLWSNSQGCPWHVPSCQSLLLEMYHHRHQSLHIQYLGAKKKKKQSWICRKLDTSKRNLLRCFCVRGLWQLKLSKAICWCLRISRSVSPCWVCAMKACECPIVRPGIEAFENETFSLPKDSCS